MRLVKGWEQEGVTIQEPYRRTIKTIYSPDEENGSIAELLFTHAIIYPHSQTDYHAHDRPELIYVVYGRQGVAPVGVGLLHRLFIHAVCRLLQQGKLESILDGKACREMKSGNWEKS